MKKVLSEDHEKFLCMQRLDGKKIRELAEEWAIGIGTVHSILTRHGVKLPEQNSPKKKKRGRQHAQAESEPRFKASEKR